MKNNIDKRITGYDQGGQHIIEDYTLKRENGFLLWATPLLFGLVCSLLFAKFTATDSDLSNRIENKDAVQTVMQTQLLYIAYNTAMVCKKLNLNDCIPYDKIVTARITPQLPNLGN